MNRWRLSSIALSIFSMLSIASIQVMASAGPHNESHATDDFRECSTIVTVGDHPALTIDVLSRDAASIAVVSVETVRASRWNTAGGRRPNGLKEMRESNAAIVRPITMQVEEVLSGAVDGDTVAGYVLGGQVGCDTMLTENFVDPTVGQRYVAVSGGGAAGAQQGVERIAYMWAIRDGMVESRELGEVPLTTLRAAFRASAP